MKQHVVTFSIAMMLILTVGCAMPLKMGPPPTPDVSQVKALPYTAGLYFTPELKSYQYVVATSPLDKMAYPIGEQTVQLLSQCMPKVFAKVVPLDSLTDTKGVDVIVEPTIVSFNAVIPHPAYNPYTATSIYKVAVMDSKGQVLFTQTATGNAQSSKGLMSGFSARKICADVAQKAMGDAARQLVEGIADAEELAHLK
jgi:hypothetical protein